MAIENVTQSPVSVLLLVRADMGREPLHQEAAKYAQQGIPVMFFPSQESVEAFRMEVGRNV